MATISFARGVPAPECLPVEQLADCARTALERDGRTVLSYGPSPGYAPLREWLAERHGVDVGRVFVTNGSLQGFVFLAQRLAAGKRVLVEKPTYDRPLKILRELGTPFLIHQPSYSMLNRWVEDGLLDTLEKLGVGCIAFSPLAQGMLTSKYLKGVPEGSRATRSGSLPAEFLSEDNLRRIRGLNEIAQSRGQTLAQMAIAWVLRDLRVTSALIGARNVEQLEDSLGALKRLDFTKAELTRIDELATEGGIDIWRQSEKAVPR